MTVSRKYSFIIACLLAIGAWFDGAMAATPGFKVSGLPVYAPERPILWSVCTETSKRLPYELFRIPPEDRMNFLGGMIPFDRYIVGQTALTAGTWQLDGFVEDGRDHRVETSLPPLPTGTYLLVVDREVFVPFQVSDIAFFDWGTVGVTASRTTGNALSGATIDRFTAEYDYTVHLNRYERLGPTRHADTNGFTDLNGPVGTFFLIRHGDDSLIRTFVPPIPLAANRSGIKGNDTVAGVHLFLSLPGYSPGDSVRFKGVLWGREGERGTPFPITGKTLLFTPEPPTEEDDRAVILHAVTDSSGGFTGGFRLPDRADTGLWQWRIQPVRPSRTDRRLAEAADTTGQEPGRFMFTNTTVPFRVGGYRTSPSELEIRVENRDTVLTAALPDRCESIDSATHVFYSIENRNGKTQQGVICLDADTAPTATPEQHLDLSAFAPEDDLNILLAYVRDGRLLQQHIYREGHIPSPALDITIDRLSDTAYIRCMDTLTLHVYRHGRGVAVPLTLTLHHDEHPARSSEHLFSSRPHRLVPPAPPAPFSRQFRYDPVWDNVTDCQRTIPADRRSASIVSIAPPDGTRPSRRDGQNASVYFFPTLWSDADGCLSLPFNLPARPGRYRWVIAAYDRDLQAAYATQTFQAVQDYRYSRRLPRIFYVGNLFRLAAKATRPNPVQAPCFVWKTVHIPFSIQPGEQIALTLPKPLRKALRKSQETDTSFHWMPDATRRLTRLCEEISLDTTPDAWNALLHYLKNQLSHGKSEQTTTAYNRLHRFLTDEGGFCRFKGQPADSTVSLAIAEALAANVANGLSIRLLLRHSLLPYLEQTAYGSPDADSSAGLPTAHRLRYLYTAASTYGPTAHQYTATLNRDLRAFAENIDRYPIRTGIYGLYALYLHGDTALFEQCRQHYCTDLHTYGQNMELQTAALIYRLLMSRNKRADAADLSRWIGRRDRTQAIDALNLAYNERLFPLPAWPDTTVAIWKLHGRRLTIDWCLADTTAADTVNTCVYGILTFSYTQKIPVLTSSETPRNRPRPARTNRRRICGSTAL